MEAKEIQKLFRSEKRPDDIELCLVNLRMLEDNARHSKTVAAIEEWARALTEGRLLGIKYRDKEFLAFVQKKTSGMTTLGLGLRRERAPFAVAEAGPRRPAHFHARRS